MIKKAVLLTLSAPFLMVFSDYSFSADGYFYYKGSRFFSSPSAYCSSVNNYDSTTYIVHIGVRFDSPTYFRCIGRKYWGEGQGDNSGEPVLDQNSIYGSGYVASCATHPNCNFDSEFHSAVQTNPDLLPKINDEECQSENGGSISVSPSSANYLQTGGSVKTHGGACAITGASGSVTGCADDGGGLFCSLDIISESTGEFGTFSSDSSLNGAWGAGDGTFSVVDFSGNDYLTELPGRCSDSSNCVTIGDQSFLVDWDSAPDHFEYVGSDGNTYSKPSSGGGSGGDNGGDTGGGDPTDPTNPTDPTDPGGNDGGDSGGDSGSSDGGNDSGDGSGGSSGGGGSIVPEFEFDESGIIEAIGSAGRSNRDAINAFSNDVTSSINNQTNELNNATSTQTDALSGALNTQTDTITNSLDTQTDSVTSALDDQTGTLTGSLDALGTSIVDAINAFGSGEGDSQGDADSEGDGFFGRLRGLFDGLVDGLADRFDSKLDGALNPNDMPSDADAAGMIDGEGAIDSIMESLDQGAEEQKATIYEEFQGVFEGGGIIDGTLQPLRDFVTTFLPSIPSGGCTPLIFGNGQRSFVIDCEGFNLLKAALSWVLFFFTAYQLISIPMDSRKTQ